MFISLTTDFGDAYTATCAGVVYTIAPAATVLVLSDEVTPYAIVEGAMLLRQALPYLPRGVHVGIVDPGVGTPRRPVAITTGRGDVLIGPDNGLLPPAAERLGGAVTAHLLENPAYRLPEVSSSFHGRDIFSPAAAHLAAGTALTDLGPEIDIADLVRLDLPAPVIGDGELKATVLYTDRFGSLITSADENDLTSALGPLRHGTVLEASWHNGTARLPYEATYGRVAKGEALIWTDSSGLLGLAVNQGSAAEHFGLGDGAVLTIRRALAH
ncbi:SAM hydrolase/SAM-dependent halogenase family protein [Actinomadura rugatobispora]|uniref:S-adenosyl-l-methionine hydroxide adenosyltransferase family protein n=1 Tax=Actinomadura rugatobispora TaxID=1994 RepID=A0ABW1AAY9_9ACTN|nr:SAM-dependent chlorinase/fluorinase [Actinomadura rugatobispora]